MKKEVLVFALLITFMAVHTPRDVLAQQQSYSSQQQQSDIAQGSIQAEDIVVDFRNIVDTNNDGLLSLDEIESLLDRTVFGYYRLFIDELSTGSDTNNDGYLSQLETRQFLSNLVTNYPTIWRNVYLYIREQRLAGRQAAVE